MKDRIKNRSDLSRLESWAQSKARKYYRDTKLSLRFRSVVVEMQGGKMAWQFI